MIEEEFKRKKSIIPSEESKLVTNLMRAREKYPTNEKIDKWCSIDAMKELVSRLPMKDIISYQVIDDPVGAVFYTEASETMEDGVPKIEMEIRMKPIAAMSRYIGSVEDMGSDIEDVSDAIADALAKEALEAIRAGCQDEGRFYELAKGQLDQVSEILKDKDNAWLGAPRVYTGSEELGWEIGHFHLPALEHDEAMVVWCGDHFLNKFATYSLYQIPIPIEDRYLMRYHLHIEPARFAWIKTEL